MTKTLSGTLLCTLALVVHAPAQADTFEVDAVGDALSVPCNALNATNLATAALPGGITLREAICAANNHPGQDNIVFANSVFASTGLPDRATILLDLGAPGDNQNQHGDLDVRDALSISAGSGRRVVLVAGPNRRVLQVHDTSLTIDRVSVRQGSLNGAPGAGILVDGSLSGIHCRVVNNRVAGADGAGIAIRGGTLKLHNCDVSDNRVLGAQHGGAGIYAEDSHTLIRRSRIRNNLADGGAQGGGGVYVNGGEARVQRSVFSGNGALLAKGGGLFNLAASVEVTRTRFVMNTATGFGLDGHGGAVYQTTQGTSTAASVLTDSLFTDNSAQHGGAIANSPQGLNVASTVTVDGSRIVGNLAVDGGGVHVSDGTFTLTDSVLSENQALSRGGGLFAVGLATIALSECEVHENSSATTGGGLTLLGGATTVTSVSILGCKMANNTATEQGGAILFVGSNNPGAISNLTVEDSDFRENAAGEDGGALSVVGIEASIATTTFVDNRADGRAGAITALAANGHANFTLRDSLFEGNRAVFMGGALQLVGYRDQPTDITNVAFFDNHSGLQGGAVSARNSSLRLNHSTFSRNQSNLDGCGVHVEYDNATGAMTAEVFNNTVAFNACLAGTGGLTLDSDSVPVALYNNIVIGNLGNAPGWELNVVNSPGPAGDTNLIGHDGIETDRAVAGLTSSPPRHLILITQDSDKPLPISDIINPLLTIGATTAFHAQPFPSPVRGRGNPDWCRNPQQGNCHLGHH